jgi:heme/copper-type cytochrome/quinol oxidase subunit 2
MDLISILATVILTTTIGTVIIGVAAYGAFKLRDKRKPKAKKDNKELSGKAGLEPIFLRRYTPAEPAGDTPAA